MRATHAKVGVRPYFEAVVVMDESRAVLYHPRSAQVSSRFVLVVASDL